MPRVISRTLEATVVGSRRVVPIVPGTVLELEDIVGETGGRPVTLAEALGPELVACCDFLVPAAAEPATPARPRGRHGKPDRGDAAAEE